MSVAAAQSRAFFDEVRSEGAVWTVRDEGGYPAPRNGSGQRAQPFWSKKSRAEKVISSVRAYGGFVVDRIELADFRDNWLPNLARDQILVGVNWSGSRATGYDLEANEVAARLGVLDLTLAAKLVRFLRFKS